MSTLQENLLLYAPSFCYGNLLCLYLIVLREYWEAYKHTIAVYKAVEDMSDSKIQDVSSRALCVCNQGRFMRTLILNSIYTVLCSLRLITGNPIYLQGLVYTQLTFERTFMVKFSLERNKNKNRMTGRRISLHLHA